MGQGFNQDLDLNNAVELATSPLEDRIDTLEANIQKLDNAIKAVAASILVYAESINEQVAGLTKVCEVIMDRVEQNERAQKGSI